jgi:heme/copper-type cytochrome/quinol oxidase subunit 4
LKLYSQGGLPKSFFVFIGLIVSIPFTAVNITLIGEFKIDSNSSNWLLMLVNLISLVIIFVSFSMVDIRKARKDAMLRCLIYSGFILAILIANIVYTIQCVQSGKNRVAVGARMVNVLESFFGGALQASFLLFQAVDHKGGYAFF